jgi:transketolase
VDTGSLGHGLGIGAGIALSAKMDRKDFMTVVLMGDGECFEGSVWEAGMFAAKHRLDNLVGIVDLNGQCVNDFIEDCLQLAPLWDKWRSFGWDVSVINGHSFEEILSTFSDFRNRKSDRPLMIIAKTIKGKGISFMEGVIEWHHSVPKGQQVEIARRELKKEGGY